MTNVLLSNHRLKVQVFGNPGAVFFECFHIEANPLFGHLQIVVVEVDVEQVNIPRYFNRGESVGLNNLPGDGERSSLGVIVHIFIFGLLYFVVLFLQQSFKQLRGEQISRFGTCLSIVFVQTPAFMQPFPQNAQPNLAGCHILHQVHDAVVIEEVGRL